MMRIPCEAVLLDAGGVIALPNRDLVAGALATVGVAIDPSAVPAAHYQAARRLDPRRSTYLEELCRALGVAAKHLPEATRVMSELADRDRSGTVLWNEPTPGSRETMAALRQAGVPVVIVTNSDGHAAENLRDAGICQAGAGTGVPVAAVIDSHIVRSAKPDGGIFRRALQRAGVAAERAVHVGDSLAADVAGAAAAGITPIHFDPLRRCRSADHRHLKTLSGVWRHIDITRPHERITRGIG